MPIQCAGVYKHVWAFEKKSKLSFIVILYSCKPTSSYVSQGEMRLIRKMRLIRQMRFWLITLEIEFLSLYFLIRQEILPY